MRHNICNWLRRKCKVKNVNGVISIECLICFHKCDIVFNTIIHKYIKNDRFYKLSGKIRQENTPAGEE